MSNVINGNNKIDLCNRFSKKETSLTSSNEISKVIENIFNEIDYCDFTDNKRNKCYDDTTKLLQYIPSDKRKNFATLHFSTNTGNIPIKPEESLLNKLKYDIEKPVYWGYHVFVVGQDGLAYDLALDKEHFGIPLEMYKEKVLHRINPYDEKKLRVSLMPSFYFLLCEKITNADIEKYKIGTLSSVNFNTINRQF